MPARPRTPSPGPDEPKYLTVAWPYPLHANMELPGDLKQCAYWIASCIGPDPLLAVFYKPSSPNMIIIEVERSFESWDCLLGEHKWADFLRSPSLEELDKVSRVFYCTFSTGRQVQKHGWLRKDVQSSWFDMWTRNNRIVKHPYPATSYCPTPPEDKTNAPLCRPLPVKSFPPPPPPRMPPVGSPEWLKLKENEKDAAVAGLRAPKRKSARARGAPMSASAPGTTNAGPAKRAASFPSGDARPSAPRISSSVGAPSLPPGINTPAPLTTSTLSHASSQGSLSISPSSTHDDWPAVPPALTRGSSTTSGSSSGSGSGRITPGAISEHGTLPMGDGVAHALATLTFEDDLWEAGQEEIPIVFERQGGPDEFIVGESPIVVPQEIPPEPRLEWAGYSFRNDQDVGDKEPEIECKTHGKLCKKGICKQYKAQKQERERGKAAADRKVEMEKRAAAKSLKKKEGPKTRYNMLQPRNAPPQIIPPKEVTANNGWGKRPAGAIASIPSSGTSSVSEDISQRPAKGRRMNVAQGSTSFSTEPVVSKTAGPPSEGASTSGGWGNVSSGPWDGPSAPAGSNAKKPPSSIASSGWGAVSDGPWGASKGRVMTQKPPSSVASSGWGNVSDGPWGAINGKTHVQKKGPSSVVSSASGWGAVSNGPWGSRAPSIHGYSDDDDDDDARTLDGKDEEEPPQARSVGDLWASPSGHANKSWAEQVEDEDNKSVVSSTGGWGTISNGPW